MARRFTALYGAGELDSTTVKQKLLGQSRLTGVWVRDDREGTPTRSFLMGIGH